MVKKIAENPSEQDEDKRSPQQKYDDALNIYIDHLSQAKAEGRKKLVLSKIAKESSLNRTTFYKPNFSESKYNKLFTDLGEKITNWNKDESREFDDTLIGIKDEKISRLTKESENAQNQSARLLIEKNRLSASLSSSRKKIEELQENLDKYAYEAISSPKIKQSFVGSAKVFSPDKLLFVDGRYNFDDITLRNSAWSDTRKSITAELKKPILTRVYLMVGLPCSGKTTWIEQIKLYPDRHSLIIDCCNLTLIDRFEWANLIAKTNPAVLICAVVINTPIPLIQTRNMARPFDRQIPTSILNEYVLRLEKVDIERETFIDEIIVVRN